MTDCAQLLSVTLRTRLLTQAIELCSTLNAVLDTIGPSRFIKSLVNDTPSSFADNGQSLLELSRLEDSLHRKLQEISEARNAVLAPILRLPDDVLRHIFTLPTSSKAFEDDHWPIRLSLVCRHWRAVAQDTAVIWAFLTIGPAVPRSPFPSAWGGRSFLLHPWYDRMRVEATAKVDAAHFVLSKEALLLVSLLLFDKELISSQVDSFVANCTNRVHQLRIEPGQHIDGVNALMPCVSVTRLVLRHLQVNFPTVGADLGRLVVFVEELFRTDMPRLTDLVLQDAPIPTNGGDPYLAFSTCKRVVISTHQDQVVHRNDLIRLLQSCPNVRHLRLYFPGMIHPTVPDPVLAFSIPADHRVHLLKLETVGLSSERNAYLPASIILAPSLTHLQLGLTSSNNLVLAETLSIICEFLRVSAAQLKSLTALGLSAAAVVSILQLAPSITNLTYLATNDYIELVRLLNNPMGSEAACVGPFLERLAFPGLPMMPDRAIFQELRTLLHNRNLNRATGSSAIRELEISSRADPPASPEKTRLLEEQLAAEVESLIVRQGVWEGAPTWKFDRSAREWKRRKLARTWEA